MRPDGQRRWEQSLAEVEALTVIDIPHFLEFIDAICHVFIIHKTNARWHQSVYLAWAKNSSHWGKMIARA